MKNIEKIRSKVFGKEDFKYILNIWRFQEHKTVFTNGCFDILHMGHVHLLANARDLGDKLILGLNSDNSVQKLKGDGRPYTGEKDRAMLLASFSFVDAIVIFQEDTPLELIKFIEPDVLVKGGDYKPEDVVGGDIVKKGGGEVEIIEYLDGYSSSSIGVKL